MTTVDPTVYPSDPHVFVRDGSEVDPRFPDLCVVCGYSESSKQVRHLFSEREVAPSTIAVWRSAQNPKDFLISHFTGNISLSEEDIKELYRQLTDIFDNEQ